MEETTRYGVLLCRNDALNLHEQKRSLPRSIIERKEMLREDNFSGEKHGRRRIVSASACAQ